MQGANLWLETFRSLSLGLSFGESRLREERLQDSGVHVFKLYTTLFLCIAWPCPPETWMSALESLHSAMVSKLGRRSHLFRLELQFLLGSVANFLAVTDIRQEWLGGRRRSTTARRLSLGLLDFALRCICRPCSELTRDMVKPTWDSILMQAQYIAGFEGRHAI